MDLLRKLRTLLGAWVHQPQAKPHPREREVEGKPAGSPAEERAEPAERAALREGARDASEGERVADLIERQKAGLDRGEG